jgi:hypothetical protein
MEETSQWRVAVVGSEKMVAEAGVQFGNPEEGERPPLEADTKQRLVKTEKTLCAVVGMCDSLRLS